MAIIVAVLVSLLAVVASIVGDVTDQPAELQVILDYVNSKNTTWKAGRNFHPDFKKSQVRRLLGHRKREDEGVFPVKEVEVVLRDGEIPESFDARDVWKDCPYIGHIRDQSDCGSCWAVSAAATFTDRLCVASRAQFTAQLSAAELLSCCVHCGDGCDGGFDYRAWLYFRNHGVVTGGDFRSDEGCQPYPLEPCEHHVNGSRTPCTAMGAPPTPECQRSCTNSDYSTPYSQDHHKAKHVYQVMSSVEAIQRDIMVYGPVQAGFTVYTDFLSYKSGVYQHVAGDSEGGHAVKVIGWGLEDDVPYWLVANSWNTDWGDDGFFKILRGSDECGFESEITAGTPKWST